MQVTKFRSSTQIESQIVWVDFKWTLSSKIILNPDYNTINHPTCLCDSIPKTDHTSILWSENNRNAFHN